MSTHKSFASLTGSMLARKTALRPATDLAVSNDPDWLAPAALPAVESPVEPAPAEPAAPLLAHKAAPASKVVPLVRPAVQPTGLKPMPVRRTRPAAFTLRVDPDRHLRLRVACSLHARSAQSLVTEAVDRLLAEMPEVEAVAKRITADSIVRPMWDSKP